jgi:hypothetical protein
MENKYSEMDEEVISKIKEIIEKLDDIIRIRNHNKKLVLPSENRKI